MDPKAVIDSYIDEVARHLPARYRQDIGLELRDLLNEELADKAEAEGREPDEAMAIALLRSFGTPVEAADRYVPTGFTIVRPSEARLFSMVALGGVLVQWALSFPITMFSPSSEEFLVRLQHWFLGPAIAAFAWPGIMVTGAILIGLLRLRPSEKEERVAAMIAGKGRAPAMPRSVLDPERIDRRLWGLAVAGFVFGMIAYALAPALLDRLPDPAHGVLTLDQGFVRARAPWLMAPWTLQLALFLLVLKDGRWTRRTRLAEPLLNFAGALVVAWFLVAGPIFANPDVDAFAKLVTAAVTAMVLLVSVVKLRREGMRVGALPPQD